jgi:hypothetical protein
MAGLGTSLRISENLFKHSSQQVRRFVDKAKWKRNEWVKHINIVSFTLRAVCQLGFSQQIFRGLLLKMLSEME